MGGRKVRKWPNESDFEPNENWGRQKMAKLADSFGRAEQISPTRAPARTTGFTGLRAVTLIDPHADMH